MDELDRRLIALLRADGRLSAVVHAKILKVSRGTPAVMLALQGFPEVEVVHTTNGRWDMVAELSAASLEAFSRALDEIRLIDGIASSETSLLLDSRRL